MELGQGTFGDLLPMNKRVISGLGETRASEARSGGGSGGQSSIS